MKNIILLFIASNMDYDNKPKFNRQFSFRAAGYKSMDFKDDDTFPKLIPTIILPTITLPECKNNDCKECQTSKKLEEAFKIEKEKCSML